VGVICWSLEGELLQVYWKVLDQSEDCCGTSSGRAHEEEGEDVTSCDEVSSVGSWDSWDSWESDVFEVS